MPRAHWDKMELNFPGSDQDSRHLPRHGHGLEYFEIDRCNRRRRLTRPIKSWHHETLFEPRVRHWYDLSNFGTFLALRSAGSSLREHLALRLHENIPFLQSSRANSVHR